jgi:hypothetical protein
MGSVSGTHRLDLADLELIASGVGAGAATANDRKPPRAGTPAGVTMFVKMFTKF